jgi:hypothetical protein
MVLSICLRQKLDTAPHNHQARSDFWKTRSSSKMADQWRITWYEEGEEPLVEVVSSFADAWALAQPYPDEDGLQWQWMPRQDAHLQFANGAQALVAAWVDNATRTVVERM